MHIGIFSKRNWRFVPLRRKVLCSILVLSSVPLHLLYNTVIYTDVGSYDYMSLLVSKEFMSGPPVNMTSSPPTATGDELQNRDMVPALQTLAQNNSLQLLDKNQCIQTFAQEVITRYSVVILLTSASNASHEILNSDVQSLNRTYENSGSMIGPESISSILTWICSTTSGLEGSYCDPKVQQQNTTWSVPVSNWKADPDFASVDRCLAKEESGHCSILFSRPLMISVIICNVLKIACLATTLFLSDFNPLVTVGDAIASFLARPDSNTQGLGPVSCVDVREGKWMRKGHFRGLRDSIRPTAGYWSADVHRSYLVASGAQWTATCIW